VPPRSARPGQLDRVLQRGVQDAVGALDALLRKSRRALASGRGRPELLEEDRHVAAGQVPEPDVAEQRNDLLPRHAPVAVERRRAQARLLQREPLALEVVGEHAPARGGRTTTSEHGHGLVHGVVAFASGAEAALGHVAPLAEARDLELVGPRIAATTDRSLHGRTSAHRWSGGTRRAVRQRTRGCPTPTGGCPTPSGSRRQAGPARVYAEGCLRGTTWDWSLRSVRCGGGLLGRVRCVACCGSRVVDELRGEGAVPPAR